MTGSETTGKALGYAGLMPFVVFSIGCWIPLPYIDNDPYILITYGAVILSFMGAVHWGVAMTYDEENRSKYFIASVIPVLAAWPALFAPETLAFIILIVGFILLIAYDWYVNKPQGLPDWYISMRNVLTVVVVICLNAALVSLHLN